MTLPPTPRFDRRQTLLWLRGTGLGDWLAYYTFLKQFTLAQLAEFALIVGTSGGGGVLWLRVCAELGYFQPATFAKLDTTIRCALNRRSVWERLARCAAGRSPYQASENLAVLHAVAAPEAFQWTTQSFPLQNFRLLTAFGRSGYREFSCGPGQGALPLAELIAIGGTPPSGQNLSLSPAPGCFDFETSAQEVRRGYRHQLAVAYPSLEKLVINTRLDRPRDAQGFTYWRLSTERWPRLATALDLLLLVLNLPGRSFTSRALRAKSAVQRLALRL